MKMIRKMVMNKTKISNKMFAALLIAATTFVANTQSIFAQSPSGRAIMKLVDERENGKDRRVKSQMTLVSKSGKKRVRSMLVYSKDYGKDAKSIFYFERPADVKGTGFLTWTYDNPSKEDDRWLYLPALKSSRRISGSSKNDYFMGSDLTYDDMGGRSLDEDTHTFLREEKVDGQNCWVVKSVAKKKGGMYSKVISYVSKDKNIIVKANFFDLQKKLLKTLKVKNIQKVQGFWVAKKTLVKNVQNKHKTILETKKIKFNLGLKDSLFRVSTLERGHLR